MRYNVTRVNGESIVRVAMQSDLQCGCVARSIRVDQCVALWMGRGLGKRVRTFTKTFSSTLYGLRKRTSLPDVCGMRKKGHHIEYALGGEAAASPQIIHAQTDAQRRTEPELALSLSLSLSLHLSLSTMCGCVSKYSLSLSLSLSRKSLSPAQSLYAVYVCLSMYSLSLSFQEISLPLSLSPGWGTSQVFVSAHHTRTVTGIHVSGKMKR